MACALYRGVRRKPQLLFAAGRVATIAPQQRFESALAAFWRKPLIGDAFVLGIRLAKLQQQFGRLADIRHFAIEPALLVCGQVRTVTGIRDGLRLLKYLTR